MTNDTEKPNTIFVVIVDDPSKRQDVLQKLKEKFEAYIHRNEAVILVADKAALTTDVADAAGFLDKNDELTGAVFRLGDGYAGYTARSLWEWLKARE